MAGKAAELTEIIPEKTPFLKNPKPIKFIAGKTAKRARPNFKNPPAEKKPLVFLTVGVSRLGWECGLATETGKA